MSKVIIFGTGRGADVAFRYISSDTDHQICGFSVDKAYLEVTEFQGLPVVDFENVESHYPPSEYKFFVPMGYESMNKLRCAKYLEAKEKGYSFISYVSSTIQKLEDFDIGENCFILENQSINFDVKIGNNVTIWSSNQIGDSTVIMDHCWISSQVCISGNVVVRPYSVIGINATISNNVTIEEESFIGANALITKDTEVKGVYLVESTKKAPLSSDRFVAMMNRQ